MGVYYIGSIPCSGGDIYHYGRKGMKWGKNIFGKISEFFTGNNARSQLNAARANQRGYNTQNRLAAKYDYYDVDNNGSALNWRAEKRNMGKNPKGYGGSISARERVQNAQAAYDKTLPGMMAKAREQVSKAYSDAASSLSGKGLDIQSFYSQVMQKAQGAINQGKNMVSKYGGQFVSQIQELGGKALEGGKNFLTPILNRAKDAGKNVREFATGENARRRLNSPMANMDENTRRNNQAAYDRTLPGIIEKVGRGARGAADRVRDTVNDVGDRVSSTAKTAGRKAKKAKRDVTDYITGNRSRYELNRAKAAERGANTQHRLASMYDYEDVDNNGSVLNRASRDDYYARERRAQAQAAYDKTLPGQIEKARKKRKK